MPYRSQGAAELSRRRLFSMGGGLVAGLALASCTDGTSTSAGSNRGTAPEAGMRIPDPVVELPSGDVTFRLVDSNDTKAPFWEQLFDAYEKKHANITCQYDGLPWDKIEEVVPLGIRNQTAHDVIQLPSSIPLPQAVANRWAAPLDDLLPDIEAWKAQFPELSYIEGSRVFDGKVYSVRLASDRRYYCGIHYNKAYMDEAGYDPQAKPLTWDEYRDAARKITKAGNGQYYGVVIEIAQPDRLALYIDYLARAAGAPSLGGVDPKTGEFYYTKAEVADAIELLLALQRDGSIFPGSNSLLAPECWPRVFRGDAGMVSAGPWVTVQWNTEDPAFDFGVGASPVTTSDPLPQGFSELGGDSVIIYAESKVQEVAADVLHFVTSIEGQTAWAKICGVGNPPVLEEAVQAARSEFSEQAKQCIELAEPMVANPEAAIANPDTALAIQEEQTLSPNWGETIQAIFVGEIDNIPKALTDLKDRSERNRDAAIAAARKKGAQVSREDWTFPNWDPRKSYTKADYEAR